MTVTRLTLMVVTLPAKLKTDGIASETHVLRSAEIFTELELKFVTMEIR